MDFEQKIVAVRSFNRFYTKQIGVLREGLLKTQFSLTEARIIFELAQRENLTASTLQRELGIDAGYMSRILHSFDTNGLIDKVRSKTDGRQRILLLTKKGIEAFEMLNSRASEDVESMLRELSPEDQNRLLNSMQTIKSVLTKRQPKATYIIRPHQPGDIGWVIFRHGVLYSQEYGWDETFEAFVAGILSDFIKNYDAKRERSWIVEMDGEIVGSVFICKGSEATAKLRLLLVEPKVRGMGIGSRLVDECLQFARRVGYEKITLWTNSVLLAARHIYTKAGFRIVKKETHHSFGHDLIGENWELDLRE